jgi:hypothetical protein
MREGAQFVFQFAVEERDRLVPISTCTSAVPRGSDVGAGDVGVLGMTELGLDSRTK